MHLNTEYSPHLLFHHEDRGNRFIRNFGTCKTTMFTETHASGEECRDELPSSQIYPSAQYSISSRNSYCIIKGIHVEEVPHFNPIPLIQLL